jgi:hypothetical protein
MVLWAAKTGQAAPMGTAFTYQGHLYDNNEAADGLYDFQFRLYDGNDPCDSSRIGGDVNKPDVDVIGGYFTAELDFNDPCVFNGEARWLEIGVRAGDMNDPNAYTILSPRQKITPTPYALYSRSDSVALHKYGEGNILVISPADDVIAKYNWLKSAERNSQMGTLSSNNRRVLALLPGRYIETALFVLDTDYVDVVGLSGSSGNTVIERNGGGYVMRQTANSIELSGIKILNSGNVVGDGAFEVNAVNNNGLSKYRRVEFRKTNGNSFSASVCGTSDIGGIWEFCEGDAQFCKTATDKKLTGTFKFCTGGNSSFYGGGGLSEISGTFIHCTAGSSSFNGGIVSGRFEYCTAGNYSFGGSAGGAGNDCSGTFRYCTAGDQSFAMGKIFSGTAIGCTGGYRCFAGYIGSGGDRPFFTGEARDCVAKGESFGGGSDQGECSGKLIGCRCTEMTTALRVAGARIEDCYFAVTAGGADREGILLKDSATKIYNTTIICTGYSIKGSMFNKDVVALHCRMNADKHPNVTNKVGDGSLAAGFCIVDTDVE